MADSIYTDYTDEHDDWQDADKEEHVPLIDEEDYRWPISYDLKDPNKSISDTADLSIDILDLLTAETCEPFFVMGGVAYKYLGWRAGKLIWQNFWWHFMREESASDYGVSVENLPNVELDYLGGHAPPKVYNFRGTTLERHVENCILAAWIGKNRFRREVINRWPNLDYDFHKVVTNPVDSKLIISKGDLAKKLVKMLSIRFSKVERLVEAFYQDLKAENGQLSLYGPGPKFSAVYKKLEAGWAKDWKERIKKVEKIVGPDVYWRKDYQIFTHANYDGGEVVSQTIEDSHWGSLSIMYNPFVAVWQGQNSLGMDIVRIFDYREEKRLDELIYLNSADSKNNKLFNKLLLPEEIGKNGKKTLGGQAKREDILARRKMRLRIRSMHKQKISLELDKVTKETVNGFLHVYSKGDIHVATEKTTPRVETLLHTCIHGKITHVPHHLVDQTLEYEVIVGEEGEKRSVVKLEQLKIKRKHAFNPEHKVVAQIDKLRIAKERHDTKIQKWKDNEDFTKIAASVANVKRYQKIEENFLKDKRYNQIDSMNSLENRKKNVMSYKFFWHIYEEMADVEIPTSSILDFIARLKKRLLKIGDQPLHARIFEKLFMMKQLRRVVSRLVKLKKIHEKYWFVYWFDWRMKMFAYCDQRRFEHSLVKLNPAETPFDEIPWVVGKTEIDMKALDAIYTKYVEDFFGTETQSEDMKLIQLPDKQTELERIANYLKECKNTNAEREFDEKYREREKVMASGEVRKIWEIRTINGHRSGPVWKEVDEDLVKKVIPRSCYADYFTDKDMRDEITDPRLGNSVAKFREAAARKQATAVTGLESDDEDPDIVVAPVHRKPEKIKEKGTAFAICGFGGKNGGPRDRPNRLPGPEAKQRTTSTWAPGPLPMKTSEDEKHGREEKIKEGEELESDEEYESGEDESGEEYDEDESEYESEEEADGARPARVTTVQQPSSDNGGCNLM